MTAIIEAKLHFLDYQVLGLNYEVDSEFQGMAEAPETTLNLKLDVRENVGSENHFMLLLEIMLNQSQEDFRRSGFRLATKIGGFFQLDPELSEQEKANYLLLNGSSMLYSTARGIVAQIMAQTPFGKQVLPSINMAEFAKDYVERKAAAGKTKNRKSDKAKPI